MDITVCERNREQGIQSVSQQALVGRTAGTLGPLARRCPYGQVRERRERPSPCSLPGEPLQDLHQLEVERQVVASEEVVGIERDVPLAQCRHYHIYRRPVLPPQVEMLAQRGLEVRGQVVPLDLQDACGLMGAIGLRRRNGDGLRFPGRQAEDGMLKAREDVPTAQGKLKRFTRA
jgi:hypothetical protein